MIVCGLSTAAYADLATGRDKLVSGDYKRAISELTAVTGKDRGAARILLARAQILRPRAACAEGATSRAIDG